MINRKKVRRGTRDIMKEDKYFRTEGYLNALKEEISS